MASFVEMWINGGKDHLFLNIDQICTVAEAKTGDQVVVKMSNGDTYELTQDEANVLRNRAAQHLAPMSPME